MYRRALFSVYQSRTALIPAHEPRLRPPACPVKVSASRLFGTSAARACEQKKDGEKSVEVKSVEVKSVEVKSVEVKSVEVKSVEVKSDESSVKNTERKSEEMTGKQGLLELLGAMKVDTTTKTRMKPHRTTGQEKPRRTAMESTSSMFQQATPSPPSPSPPSPPSESLSPELVAAVSAVASTLPGRCGVESELLKQLRKHEAVSEEKRETHNIGNIISEMKVGKKPVGRTNSWPANQIRFDDDGRGYTHDRSITGELAEIHRRNSAFTAKRLNIFSAVDQETQTDLASGPSLWDTDSANQISGVVNQRPRNGFEEMIQWTRDGKLWQFPVNNEAGMEEEAAVPFHEHVFLQRHLEDGFPRHGPVRHFMELVIVGLGKNHCLTISQKLEHINWFRRYFLQKQEILKEAEL